MRPNRTLLAALLAVVAGAAPGWAAPDPPGPAPTPASSGTADAVAAAIADLASPFAAVREDATARLVALGPSARPAVLLAFASARDGSREPFARVLAADGSKEALDALLRALPGLKEPGDYSAVRRALWEHPEEVGAAVRTWRAAHGSVPPEIEDLSRLLDRALVERAFQSRKSRSGGTGYYRGQYDALLPWRTVAIEVCLAIAEDVEPIRPGRAPIGRYHFLSRPDFLADPWEVREMAANAVGELLRPGDDALLAKVHAAYVRLYRIEQEEFARAQRGRRWPPMVDTDRVDSLLAALYRFRRQVPPGTEVDEDTPKDPVAWYEERANLRVQELSEIGSGGFDPASFLLRIGRYDEAIARYVEAMDGEAASVAICHYNIACAHASWSIDPDVTPRQAASHRKDAMASLERAVEHGYLDWPWMEQDRDLDPIRGDPRYVRLLDGVKAQFRSTEAPPKKDAPAGPR